jgi:membrane associated rhomboid family serine protease
MLPLRDRLPTRSPPFVNYVLIAVNVLAFIWTQALISVGGASARAKEIVAHDLLMDWGLVPAELVNHPITALPTVFTSMFMHDPTGWAHIGGNMLFLWIFGDNVEDALGHARYAAFYLLCGVGAAAAQVLVDPTSTVTMVGASGAISGVLAAYGSLYPRSPITVLNPVPLLWFVFGFFLELPAWVIILEYFVVNLFSGLTSLGVQQGGVAFFAHLGGFVAGVLFVRLFMLGKARREQPVPPAARLRRLPPPVWLSPRSGPASPRARPLELVRRTVRGTRGDARRDKFRP